MENNRKKVLIISYYWPPAGGPGVQRWLKFVKYLPDFGIEPHVYIPENPTYPLLDENLLNELHIPNGFKPIAAMAVGYPSEPLLESSLAKKINFSIMPFKKCVM